MADLKYIAILPTTLQAGDRIFIKGTLIKNPNQFSINFVNETWATKNITYHMKWFVNDNKLFENHKIEGKWIDHKESHINSLDDRFLTHEQKENHNHTNKNDDDLANNNINLDSNSKNFPIVGSQFELEYIFKLDIKGQQTIYVYGINKYGSSLISSYVLDGKFQFSDIKSLQVWGDTAKVNQLSFIYN